MLVDVDIVIVVEVEEPELVVVVELSVVLVLCEFVDVVTVKVVGLTRIFERGDISTIVEKSK